MFKSGYGYLAIIYIVWGSTYLAMRVGVQEGSGFPVFSFGAIRCLIAAALLFLLALFTSRKIVIKTRDVIKLAATGLAMWIGAHGLVLWAEQHVESGFAAISVSTAPLWVLLFDSILEKVMPKAKHLLFVLLGFTGIGTLIFPKLQMQETNSIIGFVCLILATVIWSLSSIYLKRNPIQLPTFTISAYQHFFGGIGFAIISLLKQEPMPTPSGEAVVALWFLVVFGSIIAFTSYVQVLKMLPTHLVTTNTYVNPIIAVLLGWIILGEPLTIWTAIAIGTVTIAISGIIRLQKE